MANQRAYICCFKCLDDKDVEMSDCSFFFLKYYPNTGWYIRGNVAKTSEWLDEFLEKHKHPSQCGRHIGIIFDGWFDKMTIDRDNVVSVAYGLIDKATAGKE